MTELNKPVRRLAREPFGHYQRRIVVILEPVDTLAMELKGSRFTVRAPLASVYRQLVAWHAESERQRKARERKLRSVV
jgi:hypothetical protein